MDSDFLAITIAVVVLVAIAIFNIFILNKEKLYDKCEARWKDEDPKTRKKNKCLLIVYYVASALLSLVAAKIVYIPHSLTLPYWGN